MAFQAVRQQNQQRAAQAAAVQQFLNTDPQAQAIIRAAQANRSFGRIGAVDNQLQPLLAQHGLSVPEGYTIGPTGIVGLTGDFWNYAAPVTAGILGGAFLSAAGGSSATSAAGTSTATGGSAAPAATGATIPDPGIGAAGVPNSLTPGVGTGTTATTAASPSLWRSVAGPAITAGAGLGGAAIQAHAANTAADAQLQANREALDFNKNIFNTRQQYLGPYIGYGQGALSTLGTGLGVSPTNVNLMQVPTQANPNAQPISLSQLTASQNGASSGPQVGTTRVINGQNARWDGNGWLPA